MNSSLNSFPGRLSGAGAIRWLFVGDSITQGAEHTYGARDYTQIFGERIRYEMKRAGDLIVNGAFSGATAAACLSNLDRLLECFLPDIAFVMVGTNDSARDRAISPEDFGRDLTALTRRLVSAGADVILQTPNPLINDEAVPYRERFGGIVDSIRSVANSGRIPLIDHCLHWTTLFSGAPGRSLSEVMHDGIHPNGSGHVLLARHIFETLGIFDPSAHSCSAAFPELFPQ